jgi:endonuclease/exonuclease/phosphatase family metal-dependent hydrolase
VRGGALAAALAALVAAAGCARTPARRAQEPGPEPAVRVLTYNVNFGIPGDGPTMDALAAGNADVVLLQEINVPWEKALRARFGGSYPFIELHPRGGAGGIGFLSRLPVRSSALLRAEGDGWFPALRLVIEAPFGFLQILVVHLRPPVSDGGSWVAGHFIVPAVHEREIRAFLAELGHDMPTLVAGDFNEDEDGRALGELARRGFRSALPEFEPDRITWRWPTALGTLERRFDHLAYDPTLVPLSAHVIDAGRSDHLPVLAVFRAAPGGFDGRR